MSGPSTSKAKWKKVEIISITFWLRTGFQCSSVKQNGSFWMSARKCSRVLCKISQDLANVEIAKGGGLLFSIADTNFIFNARLCSMWLEQLPCLLPTQKPSTFLLTAFNCCQNNLIARCLNPLCIFSYLCVCILWRWNCVSQSNSSKNPTFAVDIQIKVNNFKTEFGFSYLLPSRHVGYIGKNHTLTVKSMFNTCLSAILNCDQSSSSLPAFRGWFICNKSLVCWMWGSRIRRRHWNQICCLKCKKKIFLDQCFYAQ